MAIETSIMRHKQYATYQVCLDLYSDNITTEDSYKKVFLYIIRWLKGRIGKDAISNFGDLVKYPDVEAYKSLNKEDMHGFKIKSQLDIRLFNLDSEDSWAMRISEPDNRAEFISGSKDDSDQIYGRTFITEIALHKGDDRVTLAVKILCNEPVTNTRDALSFRPAFIKAIFKDRDFQIAEGGIDRRFSFYKTYDEDEIVCDAIKIDQSNAEAFVNDLLVNEGRQMPVIICPEHAYSITYPIRRYKDGQQKILDGDLKTLVYNLMGYAHVVVVSEDMVKGLFENDQMSCSEYEDELLDKCMIFHTGIDSETGLSKEPIYCSLVDEDDYPEEDEFHGKLPFEIMEEQAKKYSVRKSFSFEPAKFYRDLKKEYYKNEGQANTAETIANLEKDISEKENNINDLQCELERSKKEYSDSISNWKSKFNNSQIRVEACDRTIDEQKQQIFDYEQQFERMKKEYEEIIHKNEIEIATLSKDAVPKASPDRLRLFERSEAKVLISCRDLYEFDFVRKLLDREIKDVLYNIYVNLQPEQRRFELLEVVLQYNQYIQENMPYLDELVYYPKDIEFYDGEVKDVIFDAIYEVSKDNELLDHILDTNGFDFAQDEKKRLIAKEFSDFRDIKPVLRVLNEIGIYPKSNNSHNKFRYYHDERYIINLACTPSDVNAGKKVTRQIIYKCL